MALSSHRILLIDDEPDILTVLSLTLKAMGDYEIETCPSGRAALEIAPAFLPNTIFLDVMMPDMDGMETLAALRSQSETAAVPIVIMTAKTGASDIGQYRLAGANAVLSKPFQKDDLTRTMLAVHQPAASPGSSDDGNSRFEKLAARYAERLPEKISEIEAAWDSLQASESFGAAASALRNLAHKLAGTAGSYGFSKLSGAAAALENELDTIPKQKRNASQATRTNMQALVDRLVSESRRPDAELADD